MASTTGTWITSCWMVTAALFAVAAVCAAQPASPSSPSPQQSDDARRIHDPASGPPPGITPPTGQPHVMVVPAGHPPVTVPAGQVPVRLPTMSGAFGPFGWPPLPGLDAWRSEPLPRRDLFQLAVAANTPMPKSYWLTHEKALFRQVLVKDRFDVLVAPVQVQGYGLDRSTRSLMTATLTARIEGAPDPYLVQRALGEGMRTLPQGEITGLANDLGATRILIVWAGHDGEGKLLVTARLLERGEGPVPWLKATTRSFGELAFTDDTPPIVAFRRAIPEIVAFAGARPAVVAKPARVTRIPSLAIPPRLTDALRLAEQDPLYRAVMLQLLGTLSPAQPERQRERMFEQSLLALDGIEAGDPAVEPLERLLRARAYYYLNSRPAALRALGDADTPEARAFRRLLNGNLPELERAVAQSTLPLLRLMLEIELRDVQVAYQLALRAKTPAFIEATIKRSPDWEFMLSRRIADNDPWATQDNLEVKLRLDREFPVRDFEAATVARGVVAIGRGPDASAVGDTAFEHVDRVRAGPPPAWRCGDTLADCPRTGYLDLMQALAVSNAVRELYKLSELQGLPEEGSRTSERLIDVLDGQPDYLLARSRVDMRVYGRSNAARQQVALGALVTAAKSAAYLEQGQSHVSRAAMIQLGVPSSESIPFVHAYTEDFPPRHYWFSVQPGRTRDPASALAYATLDFEAFRTAAGPGGAALTEVQRAELETRFRGHPERAKFAPKVAAGVDGEIAAFEAARRDRPDLWTNYWEIGFRQVTRQGRYTEALKTFTAYPGFKDRAKYEPVALSNEAYEAGSLFFWRGRLDEARQLYRISAALGTGSAASLGSEQRLETMAGRYEAAAALALQRAGRYNDAFAYRDYLGWLFAMGSQREGWAAFDRVRPTFANQQVWLAADVGNRIGRRAWSEVRQWLVSEPIRNSPPKGQEFALAAALMQSAVDRRPAPDLPEVMRTIEGPPTLTAEASSKRVLRRTIDGQGFTGTNRSEFGPRANELFAQDTPVPSHLVMFADAYVPLRDGRYGEAVSRFVAMAGFHPIEGDRFTSFAVFALPYFAYAAAKSGDELGLEKFLTGLPEARRGFDFDLAMAFFTGLRGETDAAVKYLDAAFNVRPNTLERPIPTEYQWAEACEWLFDATGNPVYRDRALKWAKVHQSLQPMYAWAYAMEAKLATAEADRERALGFTLYLDPLSERVAGATDAAREKATRRFASLNPFAKGRSNSKGSGATTSSRGRAQPFGNLVATIGELDVGSTPAVARRFLQDENRRFTYADDVAALPRPTSASAEQ